MKKFRIHFKLKYQTIFIISIAICISLLVVLSSSMILRIKTLFDLRRQLEIAQNNMKELKGYEGIFKPPTEEEKKEWRETRERLWKFLPPQPMTNILINDLSTLALKYSIIDLSIKAEPAKRIDSTNAQEMSGLIKSFLSGGANQDTSQRNGLESVKIRLTFHTNFKNLAFFLNSFDKFNRIITVDDVEIEGQPAGLSVVLVLSAYYKPEK